MKHNRIVVLFSGYSINNTPKIKRLISCYNANGVSVEIMGIVKYSNGINNDNLYSINNYNGIVKILIVLFYQFKIFFKLLFSSNYDYVYTINPVSSILALVLHYVKGVKYVYESHEMIFGVNYPFFSGSYRNLWIFIDKLLIKNSFLFLTTDLFRLTFYRRLYKLNNNSSIDYLLNVPFIGENNFKTVNRFTDKFVISYCGGIAPGRNIEEIIEAFSFYRIKCDDAFLLLAGSISFDYMQKLIGLLNKLSIADSSYEFTGAITNPELMNYMYNSDITFALYDKSSLNNRFCSPNKVFDAIHANTPLICSKSWLTSDLCRNFSIGITIETNSSDSILRALNNFSSNNFSDFNKAIARFDFKYEFDRLKIKLLNGKD
ncbi:glycosyltransferase [Algoriphagus resistens]|uniref:glycosyltransferase n=1 Tax=Algoriphagus resistens TaxID=1750590 RepID=UPI000716AC61|nr:glycosyltransferase [Algoriphagus resistens]